MVVVLVDLLLRQGEAGMTLIYQRLRIAKLDGRNTGTSIERQCDVSVTSASYRTAADSSARPPSNSKFYKFKGLPE